MKTRILNIVYIALLLSVTSFSCKKDKKTPNPQTPPPPPNTEEVITTMKLLFTDSATNTLMVYGFQDPDGDGGVPGAFLGQNQSDSVIVLAPNKTYFMEILLLDVTKNPADTISKEVKEEGKDHMFFFNQANPSGTPASVVLAGSGIKVSYTDLDDGSPQRPLGLNTRIRTYATTGASKNPFTVTLRHQPDAKDGTYAPGDTDIEIGFKVKVN